MRLAGKAALITGAGAGIGRAIACRFAEEGADIAIHDRSIADAQQTAEMIRKLGRRAETYQVDVARADQVRSVIAKTIADFGRVHILVNDAGLNIYRPLFDFTDEDWDRIIGVNLTGTWNYCRYLGKHMVERGGGAIVNIASLAAVLASYCRAPYCASKGGVEMLTKALALDLAEQNVRVNAVAPGSIKTPMSRPWERRFASSTESMVLALSPMRRWGKPEEIANAVLFLASDEASYVTGEMLMADGGQSAGNQIGVRWRPVPDGEDGIPVPWLSRLEAQEPNQGAE